MSYNNHNNRFGRFHQASACSLCGRNARKDNGTDCCNECFELCSWDNQHNDDGTRPDANALKQYEKWLGAIGKKGGDVAKVRAFCSYLFAPDAALPVAPGGR